MRSGTIALLLGILFCADLAQLPNLTWAQFLPVFAFFALFGRPWRLPALFICGFLWALLRAGWALNPALPIALEGQDLSLIGTVASIPTRDTRRIRFDFLPAQWVIDEHSSPIPWSGPKRLRLSWYQYPPTLHPGERWQLTVRLKRPHGFSNPGGFDYEGWLFRQGVGATGYVRGKANNRRIGLSQGWLVARTRARLAAAIDKAIGDTPFRGMLKGLALGMRQELDNNQWETLRRTGTNHLMAISGLHIGLVAAFAFVVGGMLWRASGRLMLRLPAPRFAAILAILAATIYAALSGFAIPAQRALLMVLIFMLGILCARRIPPSISLSTALFVVLLLDPFSALNAGFWLSFTAVSVILYAMGARISPAGLWWKWGRVQAVVVIGLLPLSLMFFQQQALAAPLANLIAVPWVGLLVVPLTLIGTLLLLPLPTIGTDLLALAEQALALLWPTLEMLAALEPLHALAGTPPLWAVVVSFFGIAIMLLPAGVPARWCGIFWLLPLLFHAPERPAVGSYRFTLLDVGQGLAAVVETHHRVLIYDTGPAYSANFDAGRAVLLPFLRSRGWQQVDRLILSHGDRDHAGGLKSLRRGIHIKHLASSEPKRFPGATACEAGQRWRWDGVDFRILSPVVESPFRGNDRSCVLYISTPSGSVLLPGDIEKSAELKLLNAVSSLAPIDVLVAAHHGSKTSSTEAFIKAVHPRTVLFSVAYRNRFRFPHKRVVDRYRVLGSEMYRTDRDGSISFYANTDGSSPFTPHRDQARHFWNFVP